MNFEKIEIIGFKSFADKVEIVFDNGVTGIVGPNGCGKSNIADAIRWVLGEQSPKTLRGSSMTDVIFAGTTSRKSLSFCEVSLYFDNTNKIFQSLEYSEVVLTRKLFRDGTSEYFINKQPARMKDIVNLLHECGVSKNGYSIIGQGKVDEILSSKPENRRVIFEEAVGITKTKNEKNEAENKLLKTRDNITRIVDITTELERQIEPSFKAAEKTKKSITLLEELKYHEINNYLYKHDNASGIKSKIQLRLDTVNQDLLTREKESKEARESYIKHMAEIGEFDGIIANLNQQILTESIARTKTEGNSSLIKEKINFCQSEIQKLTLDIAEKEEKKELSIKAQNSKREFVTECNEKLRELDSVITKLEEELQSVNTEISKGENLAQSAQSKIIGAVESLADINRNIGSLDTEKSVITTQQQELLNKLSLMTENYNGLVAQRDSLTNDIEKTENELAHLKEEIAEIEQRITNANTDISEISSRVYSLNMAIARSETNHRFLLNMKESYEGYNLSVKRLLTASKQDNNLSSKIKGVVASLIGTDSKYEAAMETALGGSVQNIVTDTADEAKYIIEYLKKINGGKVTILPIDSIKPRYESSEVVSALREIGALGLANKLVSYDSYYEKVVSFLLGNTLVVDTIENATRIAKKFRFAFKIVTLDGDVLSPSGSMSGGSRKQQANQSVLSVDTKIKAVTEEIETNKRQIKELSDRKESLSKSCNELVTTLDSKTAKFQEITQNYTASKVKLTSLIEQITHSEKEINENNGAIDSIKARLDSISQKFKDVEEGNQKIRKEREFASNDALKHQNEYDQFKKRREELFDENTKLRAKRSALTVELNNANDDIIRLDAEIRDASLIVERNNAKIDDNRQTVSKLYKEVEEITKLYEETSGIKELKDRLNAFVEKKAKISDIINQLDLRRQVLESELSKLNDKKHAEEMAIAKVDSELEFMQQRVEEEYKLTYETCLALKDDDYNIAISTQSISDLRRKISSLGPVNPTAIEEYTELKERYDGFMLQRNDLEKAEEDLRKAIGKLSDEMLTTFNEGFDKIRVNFQRIFKELFGGGSADLLLDYSQASDPLDAGVEIVAEPPGKKLQTISLLSGGEKALTAIAILFAILKLRPMPFCVLDEIEAPLDDTNVERFARYLKRFSAETQFVVITHKKVTMELADSLFGITMPEKGVSKIVSVKLSDIADTIETD